MPDYGIRVEQPKDGIRRRDKEAVEGIGNTEASEERSKRWEQESEKCRVAFIDRGLRDPQGEARSTIRRFDGSKGR